MHQRRHGPAYTPLWESVPARIRALFPSRWDRGWPSPGLNGAWPERDMDPINRASRRRDPDGALPRRGARGGAIHGGRFADTWREGRPGRLRPLARGNRPVLLAAGAMLVVLMVLGAALVKPGNGNAQQMTVGAGGPVASASTGGFTPLTIEAEAGTNTLTGSAAVGAYANASGGQVVRLIGDWGGTHGAGALRFNNVVVPTSGVYALTFYYVNINLNEPTRSVIITASAASTTLTVAGGAACCTAQLVWVTLVKGTNAITFANPHGHAPTIDRITIELR